MPTRKPEASFHDYLMSLQSMRAPAFECGSPAEFKVLAEHGLDLAEALNGYLKALYERAREDAVFQTSMTAFDPGVVDVVKDYFADELRAMGEEAAEEQAEAAALQAAARRRQYLIAAE